MTAKRSSRTARSGSSSKPRRRVVIVGGGIGGLSLAILLARRGWRVRVLERDRRPAVASPEEAFQRWERAGVPQFRHSHTFLARLTAVMRERFPDVLNLLRTQGAPEIPLTVAIPPGLDLGPRQRGDGELVLLGARRAAFEWALLEVARRQPGIEIEEGVYVEGLVAARSRGGRPRVSGVRLRTLPPREAQLDGIPWHPSSTASADGSQRTRRISADLVVDATGRRSNADEWMQRIGGASPEEEQVPTGIFYFTRFYRSTGSPPPGATTGLVAGDVGWLKLATFPGDGDTFSITVGADIDDRPMRALSDPAVFEALIAAFPAVAPWRAPGVSRPIDGPETPVLVMGGLTNRVRRFERNGTPLAAGFVAVGDASHHSNPIYGRGVTSAVLSTVLLDDALAAHPDDLVRAAQSYHARARTEIEPYWEAAAGGDRVARALQKKRGSDGTLAWAWSWATDPARMLALLLGQAAGVFLEHGLAPASRSDGQVYRAVMRVMNMLDPPREGLFAPAVIARVLPFLALSLFSSKTNAAFPGPTREEALALIERVQRGPKREARSANRSTRERSRSREPAAAPERPRLEVLRR